MKNLISTPKIKDELIILKNKINLPKESAVSFNVDNRTFTSLHSTSTTENESKIKALVHTFGAAHVHQEGVIPVPTPCDLNIIFYCSLNYQQPATNYNFDDIHFNFTISNDGYTYILLPNNPLSFSNNSNTFSENMYDLNDYFEIEYKRIGYNSLKLANKLLILLNIQYNFNVSLYRIPTNNGIYDGKWEKLEIANPNELESDNIAIKKPYPN